MNAKNAASIGSCNTTNIKSCLWQCEKRGDLQDQRVLRISNRVCIYAENAVICRIMEFYEYQIALVAMRKTRRSVGSRVLRISNRACSNAENAAICRIMEYHEYQIALVTMRNTRRSAGSRVLRISNRACGNAEARRSAGSLSTATPTVI